MKKALYAIVQVVWGFLQTFVGFVIFLANAKRPHMNFHGAICTAWKLKSSLSLGLFIFVSDESLDLSQELKPQMRENAWFQHIAVHEYGHTIQSLILGPLYLLIVGIPSFLWASLPYFERYRIKKSRSYYDAYPELQANRLGEKVTGKRAPGRS